VIEVMVTCISAMACGVPQKRMSNTSPCAIFLGIAFIALQTVARKLLRK
jgi:hypothetical protein